MKDTQVIYSIELDKAFCFCCKLFDVNECTSNLANESSNDWNNITTKLNKPEKSNVNITHMRSWMDLEIRLSKKNITIDKQIQI